MVWFQGQKRRFRAVLWLTCYIVIAYIKERRSSGNNVFIRQGLFKRSKGLWYHLATQFFFDKLQSLKQEKILKKQTLSLNIPEVVKDIVAYINSLSKLVLMLKEPKKGNSHTFNYIVFLFLLIRSFEQHGALIQLWFTQTLQYYNKSSSENDQRNRVKSY